MCSRAGDDDTLDALLDRWMTYYEREVFPGGCLFVTAGMEFANRDGAIHDALAAAIDRQLAVLAASVAREPAFPRRPIPSSSPSSSTPSWSPATSASG